MTLPNGENILFETANRNKKSITLDLKKEKGRQLLYELVSKADIFCTNFTQSAIAKLKIDFETLKKYNPKLIYDLPQATGSQAPRATGELSTALPRPVPELCTRLAASRTRLPLRSADPYSIR